MIARSPRGRLAALMLAVVTLTLAAAGSASATDRSAWLAPAGRCDAGSDPRPQITCYVNFARQKAGVRPVTSSPKLHLTAQAKANDIAFCGDFSHTACGFAWDLQIRKAGPVGAYGENLAWGSGSLSGVRSIMAGWLNSDGHFRNIVDGRYAIEGTGRWTGTFRGAGGAAVFVQHFAAG